MMEGEVSVNQSVVALPRLVGRGLLILTLLVIVLMLTAAVLAMRHLDRQDLSRERHAVEHALDERREELGRQHRSFIGWDGVLPLLVSHTARKHYEHLGAQLSGALGFDLVVLVNGEDQPVASYRNGPVAIKSLSAQLAALAATFRGKLAASREGPGLSDRTFVKFIVTDEGPAIVSIQAILPEMSRTMQRPSLHVALEWLNETGLDIISHHSGVANLRLSAAASSSSDVPIVSGGGDTIGFLQWEPFAPGWRMIKGIAPAGLAAAICAGFAASMISGWLIRASTALSESEAEIRQHRNELERLVQIRTVEVELKNAELDRLLCREREVNALQRRFVSMISHEFRTPLSIIDTAAQRLTRVKSPISGAYLAEKSGQIRGAATRMVDLMESILAAGRLETGTLLISLKSASLADVIMECADRQLAVSKNHKVHLELDLLPPFIQIDRDAIERVFANLLSNAIKYSPNSACIFIKGWEEDGAVKVCVRDEGVGMDAEDVPNLFQPYFRAKSATGIAGTGIGLNIVREIVELHGGTISVESSLGIGTTFTVSLPLDAGGLERDRAA